ncbi:hypothetical protein PTKIN_Ptkin17bG0100800 [Pterospermum kingtungense]
MASVSYRCKAFYYDVFQPLSIPPQTRYSHRRGVVQIDLTVVVDLLIFRHDCLTGRFTRWSGSITQETLRFPLHVLRSQEQTHQVLGPMLARHEINPNSLVADVVIDEIARHGIRIGNWASNRGRKVLPLRAELWGTFEKHVRILNERIMMRRALLESALESDHGMVPANKSSVKKILKRVRVVEDEKSSAAGEGNLKKRQKFMKGEDCVICLEEIKTGSVASRMPCSHTFHGVCIEKWLQQSHYCPVCRFDVPT